MAAIPHGGIDSATQRSGKRKPQPLPHPLTVDERRALLAQPNEKAPTAVRDRALIATMLLAGLRISEALNLRQRDIDWNAKPAPLIRVIRGKGGKDRVVPAEPLLEAYLREWRARRPSGERFF